MFNSKQQKHEMLKQSFYSSQINPNYSSTNLSKINSPIPNRSGYIPNENSKSGFFQLLTPPVSNPSSPELTLKAKTTTSKWKSLIPPIDYKVTLLCIAWYFTSIISSNSTKLILTNFPYPITLTQFQFLLNSSLSILMLLILNNKQTWVTRFPPGVLPDTLDIKSLITPSSLVINTTLPMGCFQFIGHLTSHKATSLIPVSLVHTIKSLSPLITVLIYRGLYNKKFPIRTYVTLLPLITGIMMTCYKPYSSNNNTSGYTTGLLFGLFSMIIFVGQNMFAKNRLTVETDQLPMSKDKQQSNKKVDKLTILFYCSLIGFIFTSPIYIMSEIFTNTMSLFHLNGYVVSLVLLNGISHFIQSLLAFQILGMISPINYSIASILKRIFIILVSFIWESKQFTNLQSIGLLITLFGLYAYDRWGTQR
ncbi:putative transporter SLY41 [Spathaspora sp. JA1]|nr:putative transporter SLY41 [Spathaspora sp. JA1]